RDGDRYDKQLSLEAKGDKKALKAAMKEVHKSMKDEQKAAKMKAKAMKALDKAVKEEYKANQALIKATTDHNKAAATLDACKTSLDVRMVQFMFSIKWTTENRDGC
ncbi:hypothetical protein BT69DRAFT_1214006, partial [Atractiella rhizophila]